MHAHISYLLPKSTAPKQNKCIVTKLKNTFCQLKPRKLFSQFGGTNAEMNVSDVSYHSGLNAKETIFKFDRGMALTAPASK